MNLRLRKLRLNPNPKKYRIRLGNFYTHFHTSSDFKYKDSFPFNSEKMYNRIIDGKFIEYDLDNILDCEIYKELKEYPFKIIIYLLTLDRYVIIDKNDLIKE